jgi:hypothetical protein
MSKPGRKQSSQKINISVRGHLPVRYFENYGNLKVTQLENAATLISGEIGDQAQLFGLLNRIRDLGIPLLEIDCCTNEFHNEEIDNENK